MNSQHFLQTHLGNQNNIVVTNEYNLINDLITFQQKIHKSYTTIFFSYGKRVGFSDFFYFTNEWNIEEQKKVRFVKIDGGITEL